MKFCINIHKLVLYTMKKKKKFFFDFFAQKRIFSKKFSFLVWYEQMGLQLTKIESLHSNDVMHAKKIKKNGEVDFELSAAYIF